MAEMSGTHWVCIFCSTHHTTDLSVPYILVVFELAQIRHALRMEEENNKSSSYRSLIATPGNRKRTMIIVAIAAFSQWR